MPGFQQSLVTVSYYLSHSLMVKVHEQVIGMSVYFPDAIERVLRALERRETSTEKARARDSRAN